MINILQEIAAKPKDGETENQFFIRFNDLPPNKQSRLVELIKKDSSLWTIKKADGINPRQIIQIMEAANPVIWKISKNSCYGDPLFRWREHCLSQLIYHYWLVAFKNKRPKKHLQWLNKWLIFPNQYG